MWSTGHPTCTACGEPITCENFGNYCTICAQFFCADHIQVRDGISNCEACADVRRQQEEHGPISQSEVERLRTLLGRDLLETVGPGHEIVAEANLARLRLFAGPDDFEQRVVDHVQQALHDEFIDTTWPACPDHPNHPLWYSDGWWGCERSGRIALLGGLRKRST